jgi:hypothetical protein
VGRGGAAGALDQGWEAVAAAVNGELRLRQGSGEVESSGRRKVGKMGVCKCKSEFTRSSKTCFKSRRRHGERGQELASSTVHVEARAAAARCGGVGAGQRGPGNGGAGAEAARGAKGSGAGAAGARHMAGEGGGGRAQRKQREGTGGRQRGT